MVLLEYLKKSEEQENKEWYLRLAKDHFSYIGIHRDALDEIQQLKNELWKIIMNSKSENSVKIAAVKELHNLVKTKVLILRDLPFITRISKYYDLQFLIILWLVIVNHHLLLILKIIKVQKINLAIKMQLKIVI